MYRPYISNAWSGVLNAAQLKQMQERAWAALTEGAKAMAARVSDEKPERLFLRTLADLLTQGKVWFRHADGQSMSLGGAAERAEMLGWYDADKFYLLPEAAYNCIAKYYKDQGNVFPVREVTLRKMLAESGIIEIEPGRRTMMVRLDGAPRRVLVIKRSWLQEEDQKDGNAG